MRNRAVEVASVVGTLVMAGGWLLGSGPVALAGAVVVLFAAPLSLYRGWRARRT